jgi:hypothetical protein
MKLPKSLIKKYGISKKAWSIYKKRSKNSKATSKRTSKKKKEVKPMAKSKSKSILGMQTSDIWKGVGAGSAGLLGGIVNTVLPNVGGNIAQAISGLALSYYGKGAIKQVGKGVVIKTIGDLTEDQLIPMLTSGFGMNKNGGVF